MIIVILCQMCADDDDQQINYRRPNVVLDKIL